MRLLPHKSNFAGRKKLGVGGDENLVIVAYG